ncbi:MAG: PHB depolymerase family esterase, partial [Lachnospiraceae bacterium]|nr:PHB depolymerase family esterase [Lachnospiraceae bacterium]
VGGSAVKADYLESAGADFCTYLDGYEDPDHRKNLKKGDIPMPAWIIDDPAVSCGTGEAVLQYWKSACGTEEKPRLLSEDQEEYFRTRETDYPGNQDKEAYRVCHSTMAHASDNYAAALLPRIWKDFLYRQRRWMSCPGGDLRVTRDPVRDLHMDYHYEEVDGWMREWYTYVPENVKNSTGKVPLVMAMHGYTCSGEIYIGNSEWTQVADKHGFIVVFPSALHANVNMPDCGLMPDCVPLAAWNIFEEDDRPDELHYFNTMLDRTIASYPVDEDRVFATGHSWGSLMTEMLALGMTDRLAGVAPCSGAFFGGASVKMTALESLNRFNDLQLPVWMFWGMEEDWLIPGTPTKDNETGFTLEMWMKKNDKEDMIPADWKDAPVTVNGRFLDHVFEKEGTAPVRYTQVEYMPHATMPEMSFRIWEEFFSGLSRV